MLGAALGLSQAIHGAYDEITWASIALGAVALLLALAVGVPRRPPLLLLVALLALLGLWLWSLISSGWSDSTDAAHVGAARWLLYAAALAVLWWAAGERRWPALALLAGAAAGVLGVAAWMLLEMLTGHGATLFLGTRLNDPLGYINAQAGYLLAGAWPCLALAEWRDGRTIAPIAGLGMAGLVVLMGLGLLTQSRSWGLAAIGTVLSLLVFVPGRRRRAVVVLFVGAAMAAIYSALSSVWRHPSHLTGVPTAGSTRDAAVAILIAAVASGAAWAAIAYAREALVPSDSRSRRIVSRLTGGALAALVLASLLAIALNAGAIGHRIHTQYEQFVHLAPSSSGTRLLSGAGNRYDYWRVAMIEFRSAPVIGVGAGNYQPGY